MNKEKVYLSAPITFCVLKNNNYLHQTHYRLAGEVDRQELATTLKSFAEQAKKEGLRPGQRKKGGLSAEHMASLWSLTPNGNFPMNFPPERIVFKAEIPPIHINRAKVIEPQG